MREGLWRPPENTGWRLVICWTQTAPTSKVFLATLNHVRSTDDLGILVAGGFLQVWPRKNRLF